jgi:hypothetical protein
MIKNNLKINYFLGILFFAMLFIGVFTINTSAKAAPNLDISNALVEYYSFNENNNGFVNASNTSPYSTYVSGKTGTSTDRAIVMPMNYPTATPIVNENKPITNGMTVCAWIKASVNYSKNQLIKINNKFGFFNNDYDEINFHFKELTGVSTCESGSGFLYAYPNAENYWNITSNMSWHHLCYTFSNNETLAYLDNSIFYNCIHSIPTYENTQNLIIDGLMSVSSQNNYVDEITVFDRALTPSEIEEIYNADSFADIYTTPPTNDYLLIYDGGYYDNPDNELANIEDIYRYIHPPYASGKTYFNTPLKFAYNFCDYFNNEYVANGLCVGDNTNCPDFTITQHYEPKTGSNAYPDYDIIKSQVSVSFDSCSGVYEFYPDDTPLKDGKTFISLYDENILAQVAISNEVNYEVISYNHLLFGDNFLRLNGSYNYTKKFHFGYSYSTETFSIPVVWDFCGLDWYDEEIGYEVCLSGSERYCVVADSCSGFGNIEHPVPDNNQKLIRTLLVLEPSPSVNSPYIANNYWFTIEKEALPPVDTSYENFCLNTTEDLFSYGFCWITKEVFNPIFNTIKGLPNHIFPINVFNAFFDVWEESSNKSLSSDFTFLFSSVSSSGEVIIDLPDRLFTTDDDFVIFSKNWFKGDSALSSFFSGFKKITPYLFFGAYLAFLYSLLRKVKNNNID